MEESSGQPSPVQASPAPKTSSCQDSAHPPPKHESLAATLLMIHIVFFILAYIGIPLVCVFSEYGVKEKTPNVNEFIRSILTAEQKEEVSKYQNELMRKHNEADKKYWSDGGIPFLMTHTSLLPAIGLFGVLVENSRMIKTGMISASLAVVGFLISIVSPFPDEPSHYIFVKTILLTYLAFETFVLIKYWGVVRGGGADREESEENKVEKV